MRLTAASRVGHRIAHCAQAALCVLVLALSVQGAAHATVAFGTAGTAATGTTAFNVPYPATVNAGDLLVLAIANKYPNNAPTTPGGWTLQLRQQGGAGGSGADSGQVYISVYTRTAAGTEGGTNLAITVTGANTSAARMFRYTKTTSTAAWSTAVTGGSDNSAGTAWSVTGGATLGFTTGDMVFVASAINSDAAGWGTHAIAATGATFGGMTERQEGANATGDDVELTVADASVTAGTATAAPVYTATGSATAGNGPAGASVFLLIREARTTLATGTDPAAATVGPTLTGPGTAVDVNQFTLQTNTGTEAISSVTVNLSTLNGVGRLAVTDNAGTPAELGFTIAPVTGANVINVTGMTATTTLQTFRVRVIPALHSGTAPPPVQPAVPGNTYAISASVTAWVGNNFHTGTDTTANNLSIDNLSPANVTGPAVSVAVAGQATVSWTNPATADFIVGGTVLVLRKAGGAVSPDAPTEGVTYSVGNTIGTSVVACVLTGSPPGTNCVDSGLTGGVYGYRIFTQDSRGNYSAGVVAGAAGGVTVLHTVSAFNACEVYSPTRCVPGAADYDRLFTKLARTAFNLDFVAIRSGGVLNTDFAGSPTVELLAYTAVQPTPGANNCPAAVPTATIPVTTAAFAAGRRNTVAFANTAFSAVSPNYFAYRDVRVRFTCNAATCPPSGITWCSADNFAVRPTDLTVAAPVLVNALQTGSPSAAAGSDFSVTASALTTGAVAATGYNGQPVLDRTLAGQKVVTHTNNTDYTARLRDSAGGSNATFPAAAIGTGVSTATLQYHDAGNVRILAGGVVDSSWTSVDDTTKDCVGGSASNTDNDANANTGLKYGCNVGNSANSALFGRFYPHRYELSSTVTPGCPAGGFTYMGHAALGLDFTVSAMSQDNPTGASLKLNKYTAGYSTLATVGVRSENSTSGVNLTASLSPTFPPAASWSAGDYAASSASYSFSRAALSGPYDDFNVGVSVTDADGAVLNGRDFKTTDPNCTVACTHKKLAPATKIRFGRMRLLGATGSEALNLTLGLRTEYWTGTGFATNTLDSCTALTPNPAQKFVLYDHQGSITASNMVTPSAPSNNGSVSTTGLFASGIGSVVLNKATGLTTAGSLRVCLDLDSGAGGDTACQAPVPANLLHLQGNWSGTLYDKDPNARGAFGVYGAQPRQFIFIRENY